MLPDRNANPNNGGREKQVTEPIPTRSEENHSGKRAVIHTGHVWGGGREGNRRHIQNKSVNHLKYTTCHDFWSRWQRSRHGSPSLHNHIKITTEIQNNHHSELSEIKLNGSPTTTELQKPCPSRLVGGMRTQNRLVPHLGVVDKNLRGIPWEQGVPAPHQVSSYNFLNPLMQTTSGLSEPQAQH